MNCNNNMCSTNKTKEYMSRCQCLDELPLAMAYVPWQKWQNVMCASDGIKHGTIFAELVLPFYGCKGRSRG